MRSRLSQNATALRTCSNHSEFLSAKSSKSSEERAAIAGARKIGEPPLEVVFSYSLLPRFAGKYFRTSKVLFSVNIPAHHFSGWLVGCDVADVERL